MRVKAGKHYPAEDWVNFAMNQLQQSQAAMMKQHLEAGCKKCAAEVNLWSRVAQLATSGASAEPPFSAVQHVRQAFAVLAESRDAKHHALIPRLTFDSLWKPALAGVRSVSDASRHVTYAAGQMSIDMRLEPEPKSERMNLAGQISMASGEEHEFPPIVVVVSGKSGNLAATTTNSFGEFHLAFLPEQGLQISFAIAGKDEILVPLDSSAIRPR
jgi:hypothetical protein